MERSCWDSEVTFLDQIRTQAFERQGGHRIFAGRDHGIYFAARF